MKNSTIAAIAIVGGGFLLLSRRAGAGPLFGSATSTVPPYPMTRAPQPSTTSSLLTGLLGGLSKFLKPSTSGGGIGFGGGSGSSGGGGSSSGSGGYNYGASLYDTSGPFDLSAAPGLDATGPGIVEGVSAGDIGLVDGTSIDDIPFDTGSDYDASLYNSLADYYNAGDPSLDAAQGFYYDQLYTAAPADLSSEGQNVADYL